MMTIKLSPSEMLGHWTHCEPKVCEFQHGATMIYVSYTADRPMECRLKIAQATIEAAFNESESALEFARQISEKQTPDFWQTANRIPLKESPLIVFAVRYPIDSDLPIYEISWNPIFEPETAVALSEDGIEEQVEVEHLPENEEFIYVKRLDAQRYAQVA
jgi:hypothetical protein